MYPFLRMAHQLWRHRGDPPLALWDVHESRHICWPWDLDIWAELNNGRTLTLFDLGRIPWFRRLGLIPVLRRERWAVAMVGASVRWRRRVHAFDRLTMRTRLLGWDERFLYSEQAMWLTSGRHAGEVASHVLLRSAVTGRDGIVTPDRLIAAMAPLIHAEDLAPRPLPDWAAAWIAADAGRPWPPMGRAVGGPVDGPMGGPTAQP